MLTVFSTVVERISRWMLGFSGVVLTLIMLLTVSDVILRIFKTPIIGTYELVSLGGAAVIAFAIPRTSWLRGHIFVDFFYQGWPTKARMVLNLATRLICIAVYILIGWNLIQLGMDLHTSGEVTPTRHLPFYPVAYALSLCCFIECLVMVHDIFKVIGGTYE
jgi:TRAP-type C4-dicarboxylate transport system permease small subunit